MTITGKREPWCRCPADYRNIRSVFISLCSLPLHSSNIFQPAWKLGSSVLTALLGNSCGWAFLLLLIILLCLVCLACLLPLSRVHFAKVKPTVFKFTQTQKVFVNGYPQLFSSRRVSSLRNWHEKLTQGDESVLHKAGEHKRIARRVESDRSYMTQTSPFWLCPQCEVRRYVLHNKLLLHKVPYVQR